MKNALIGQLNAAYEFFDRSTRSLTEDDSGFAPAEGVFTAANQVAHAAQTIDWFIEGAFSLDGFDMNFEAHEREVRAVRSLAQARAWLKRAIENGTKVIASRTEDEWGQPLPEGPIMGGLPRTAIFGGIADHTAHHRGALTVYARLLGKIPSNPYVEAGT